MNRNQFEGSSAPAVASHMRPIIPFRESTDGPQTAEFVPLRAFYESHVFPVIKTEQAPRSISSDRSALNSWERYTENPDIRDVGRDDLLQLRDGMIKAGIGPNRINCVWRELKAMFEFGVPDWISSTPAIRRRMKTKLVPEAQKMQRAIIEADEVNRIWNACTHASYPQDTQFPAPKLFRVALVLFWYYGPRPSDLFALCWDNVDYGKRLLQFQAQKTGKLQGVPLTDLVIDHLRSIEGRSRLLFPGFNSPGCWITQRRGKAVNAWKNGYRATWHRDILPAAGIRPNCGPDETIRQAERDGFDPTITFKHFREAMVTQLNDIKDRAGNWIAAHYENGVSERFYDLPTNRVRKAVTQRERELLPECFRHVQTD